MDGYDNLFSNFHNYHSKGKGDREEKDLLMECPSHALIVIVSFSLIAVFFLLFSHINEVDVFMHETMQIDRANIKHDNDVPNY